MNRKYRLVSIPRKPFSPQAVDFLGLEAAQEALAFHKSFPGYRATPLAKLTHTAQALGLGNIYVKDESFRFGLNAFKVLGGSYAIGSYIAGQLGIRLKDLPFSAMVSPEVRAQLGEQTFVTATDGNHGRGVAWTAHKLRQKCVVYMPKGSAAERLENIRAEGAEAEITPLSYDDAVRLARRQAEEKGWVVVQDTAWQGYEEIPTRIMQGYGTMALEAWQQMKEKPTHIFLQAGVGSMAGAVAGFFASVYGEDRPVITVVEPNSADCLFRTAEALDGKLHAVTEPMTTMMAGLACGEPCSIGWQVLSSCADHFISCPDEAAAKGMRMLAGPMAGDDRVISGESGAAGFGCVAALMTNPSLDEMRRAIGLDEKSRVLCFSTEGDTDRKNYRAVVWDGRCPSEPE